MKYKITIGNNSYDIEVERKEASQVLLKNSNAPIFTETKSIACGKTSDHNNILSENSIISPMDGKIISLNFSNGDSVNEGDTILILEAMKMENEIAGLNKGIITYKVNKGDDVSSGEILAEIN